VQFVASQPYMTNLFISITNTEEQSEASSALTATLVLSDGSKIIVKLKSLPTTSATHLLKLLWEECASRLDAHLGNVNQGSASDDRCKHNEGCECHRWCEQ